jgi:hypothetical protein
MNPNLADLARETKNPALGEKSQRGKLVYSNGFNCFAFENGKNTILFSARLDENQLCYHNGMIVCGHRQKLAAPLDGIKTGIKISSICSNGKDLFITKNESRISRVNIEHQKLMESPLFENDSHPVGAIAAAGKKLWYVMKPVESDLHWYVEEYDLGLRLDSGLDRSREPIRALCCYDDRLYWGKANGVYFYEKRLDPLREFDDTVIDLTELNGKLLALVEGSGVYDVHTGEEVLPADKKAVAMCAVPGEYWK